MKVKEFGPLGAHIAGTPWIPQWGTDIPIQKHRPFVLAHAYERGMQIKTTCVNLYIEYTTIRARVANKRCLTLT